MGVALEIRQRLDAALSPLRLEVVDDSEKHRGHSGWREGGETHFRVAMTVPQFAELSRLERHRAVHEALGRDLMARIHALQLDIVTEEAGAGG